MAINPDDFIFHSAMLPFAVSERIDISCTTGSSVAANPSGNMYGTKSFAYSDWHNMMSEGVAPDLYFEDPSGVVRKTWLEWPVTGSGGNQVAVRPYAEIKDGKIRLILETTNYNTVSVTYTPVTLKLYAHTYSI